MGSQNRLSDGGLARAPMSGVYGPEGEWLIEQIEAGATVVDASVSYAQHVEKQLAAKDEEHQEELEKAVADAKNSGAGGRTGFQPLTIESAGEEAKETGDPVEDFDAAVVAMMQRGSVSRGEAGNAVRRRHPELAKAFLLETNPTQRAKRELTERFDALKV